LYAGAFEKRNSAGVSRRSRPVRSQRRKDISPPLNGAGAERNAEIAEGIIKRR
jgi:hypothetical protein